MAKILSTSTSASKNFNQSNAVNAVLFEAMDYAIHLDPNSPSVKDICKGLSVYLESADTNLRYLALETLTHMAASGSSLQLIVPYQKKVIHNLKDRDISIRQRSLDLLYSMCNEDNSREIIAELLEYVKEADYDFQEEIVLKIAILAEKHVSEYTWYVDVILKLLTTGGNATSDALWYRVIQIVTNHQDLREYAAYTILQAVKQPDCHEVTVKIAGHLLGEFGHVIVESPGCSPIEQFKALHSKFVLFSSTTKGVLLSTYFKFVNLFPEIKFEMIKVFEQYSYVLDVELQQRACEYLAISQLQDERMIQQVCEEMPPFSERESTLLKQLASKINDTEDNRTWTIDGAIKEEEPKASLQLEQEKPSPEILTALYNHLVVTDNGVLYEDNLVQICIKSEFEANQGRFALIFSNKTLLKFTNLNLNPLDSTEMKITSMDSMNTEIEKSSYIQQLYTVLLLKVPTDVYLNLNFVCDGKVREVSVKLPLIVTKFIDGVMLSSPDFYARWKQIGTAKETQSTADSNKVNIENAKILVKSVGFMVLDGVDPVSKNCCFAGIFTSGDLGKVGCLVRIESNVEHEVFIS
jgi:AP-2 complex subunit alpha